MSETTVKPEDDDKDREEPRHEPTRRLLVVRGGRLIEVTRQPSMETR